MVPFCGGPIGRGIRLSATPRHKGQLSAALHIPTSRLLTFAGCLGDTQFHQALDHSR